MVLFTHRREKNRWSWWWCWWFFDTTDFTVGTNHVNWKTTDRVMFTLFSHCGYWSDPASEKYWITWESKGGSRQLFLIWSRNVVIGQVWYHATWQSLVGSYNPQIRKVRRSFVHLSLRLLQSCFSFPSPLNKRDSRSMTMTINLTKAFRRSGTVGRSFGRVRKKSKQTLSLTSCS